MHGQKYIAAYFVKKAHPKKIPKIKKLIFLGSALIFNKINKESDQNIIKKTSVDNKKEETIDAGIRQKETPDTIAIFLSPYNSNVSK